MPWYWILIILSAIFGPFEAMYALNKARRNREEAEKKRRMESVKKEAGNITVRRATEKDIPRIMELLSQVLEVHAKIRPDIFIPGTTKYSEAEMAEMLKNEQSPVYAAVTEGDRMMGYAFCQIRKQPFSSTMVPFTSFFIDDLCVDEAYRGAGVGRMLVEHVKKEAAERGCYEITLNVWEGNDSARRFYESMGFGIKETQMEMILGQEDA